MLNVVQPRELLAKDSVHDKAPSVETGPCMINMISLIF
jgi:hypothetical protein